MERGARVGEMGVGFSVLYLSLIRLTSYDALERDDRLRALDIQVIVDGFAFIKVEGVHPAASRGPFRGHLLLDRQAIQISDPLS